MGSVELITTFCNKLDPKCMFWESKHKGKDFVKSKQIILFKIYVQTQHCTYRSN